ncbi:alpha/beta hydrolase [Lewinella sp. W8]|uniref:alpha/beta hydrolase n=1 Tax=Lewinella sp. W8 TaxID=2528208 RepID=UPI0010678456|nr:alpha/beta hydrolase [Lewinella sp. W8]MTB53130.1 alpha/beta fold hydrolase [Lewinella sp. W8]
MQYKEFHWTNDNGNKIYACEWPVANPRAVVGLIHGLGEHVHRYDGLAERFAAADVAVVGYDRQGFGRSEGRRGYAAQFREFLDEIARLLLACENRYPDLPVFLYGHSMGGQLLLRYLIRRKPDISGAIVSAPHIRTSFRPNPVIVGLGKVMRSVMPTFAQNNQLDLSQLSRNPAIAPAYAADPLVHQRLTSQTGIDMLEAARHLDQYADGVEIPTLLMHGGKDGITDPEASREFAARNPDQLTFKSWPGLYHELHHEPEREEVFAFVLSWMEDHMEAVNRWPKSV